MAETPVDVCNNALAKLGAQRISSIDAPAAPNERLMALLYPRYRDVELRRRPWHFAIAYQQIGPLQESGPNPEKPFVYDLPAVPYCLRPLRDTYTDWELVGRRLNRRDSGVITVRYISRPEDVGVYDVLFNEALSARIAYEACETVTQSTSKQEKCTAAYDKAIKEAAATNAFETGPQSYQNDAAFSWLGDRVDGGI